MSDYVTKLRGEATVAEIDGDPFCRLNPGFVREVADEIERLQNAVEEKDLYIDGQARELNRRMKGSNS